MSPEEKQDGEPEAGHAGSESPLVGKEDEPNLDATTNGVLQEIVPLKDASDSLKDLQVTEKARNLTHHLLSFLSTATNETLGACAAGLLALTYFVLGRLGLLLIGVLVGVAAHAGWEGRDSDWVDEDHVKAEGRRRREKGLDIVHRLLATRDASRDILELDDGASHHKEIGYEGLAPETTTALQALTDAVIQDYVLYWYRPILPSDETFPTACRQTLTNFFQSISNRLIRKRSCDVFLDFLTNSSSIVIVFLSELAAALSASRGEEAEVAIQNYLDSNPQCSLGNVLDVDQQKRKLKAVADDVLQTFVDSKTYNCNTIQIFLREVLAGLVLDMTVTSCSRADFLNEWIIWALEESPTTDLVTAIDAGVKDPTSDKSIQNAVEAANGVPLNGKPVENSTSQSKSKAEHRRTVSRAEAAMEEAMQEAKRLNAMIAEEEAAKQHSEEVAVVDEAESDAIQPEQAPEHSAEKDKDGTQPLPEKQSTELQTSVGKVAESAPSFKNFDEILSAQKPTALQPDVSPLPSPPIQQSQAILHKAQISIFDDSVPGEKGNIRSKPLAEYLLQVEPAISSIPGWMIARKYSDFEKLHEVLRRISVISGVTAFAQRHIALPGWKGNTKAGLRTELERYLQDALSFQALAESEGMKRFLDKDQHLPQASQNKANAFETVGKGFIDVLSSAPKGAATGGKAIVGGVTGVFGGVASLGQKKQTKPSTSTSPGPTSTSSTHSPPLDSGGIYSPQRSSASQDGVSTSSMKSRESLQIPESPYSPPPPVQSTPRQSEDISMQRSTSSISEDQGRLSLEQPELPVQSPQSFDEGDLKLPPPPSEIPDDYRTSGRPSIDESATIRSSLSTAPTSHKSNPSLAPSVAQPSSTKQRPPSAPLSIQETTVAVELFFAMINELYTLSSAWTLRLTLLNTAKALLLRPGNQNLESIRQLIQSTVLDPNTSSEAIALHISKVRENALPTEEELQRWPPPLSPEQSEQRRQKARKLLVQKGMPQALTSVMGQAASGEALGKVFDCLQVERVARGLVFAITLQAVRALTQ